jgi:hypothetical protein
MVRQQHRSTVVWSSWVVVERYRRSYGGHYQANVRPPTESARLCVCFEFEDDAVNSQPECSVDLVSCPQVPGEAGSHGLGGA